MSTDIILGSGKVTNYFNLSRYKKHSQVQYIFVLYQNKNSAGLYIFLKVLLLDELVVFAFGRREPR